MDGGVEAVGADFGSKGLGRVRKCVLGFLSGWEGSGDGSLLRESVRG